MKKLSIKNLLVAAGVILTAGLLLTGCGKTEAEDTSAADTQTTAQTSESDEPLTIRVSYWDYAPWSYQLYVAKEKGIFDEIFKDDNVELELTPFANGPATNEAVTAGKLDFIVSLGDQPFLTGLENGVDTSILSTIARQEKTQIIVVKGDSDISSVADLKGKKIAVAIGTYTHKSLIGVLKDNGVDVNDVELINFTTAGDVVSAIARGDVDAYLGSSFDLLPSLNSGEVKQIADITGYPANTYLIGTNAFIEKYPELTQKLVQAVDEGAKYIENNKEEVYPILAEQAGMDADTLTQLFPDIDMNTEFTDDDLAQIKNTEQFLIDNDLISEPIENLESEHINTTFIDKVLKGE